MDWTVILPTILIFALIIIFHELGHFLAAKASRIPVRELSLGFMRPILFQRKWGETKYSLRAIPLGGFAHIAGMDSEEDDPNGYDKKSRAARFAVLFGGPFMNFVLAALIFAVAGMCFGRIVGVTRVIERVQRGTPAQRAGLMPGDRLVSAGGVRGSIGKLQQQIRKSPGKPIAIEVTRNGKAIRLMIVPRPKDMPEKTAHGYRKIKVGQMGVVFRTINQRMGLVESLVDGVQTTYLQTRMMIIALAETVARKQPLELGGPVRIVDEMVEQASVGWMNFLRFSGFLSLNVAVVNLIPLPALDGSRIAFLGVEAIRRRPINKRLEAVIHLVGFAALMLLIALLTFHDIAYLVKKQ